jgi:spore coat protein E
MYKEIVTKAVIGKGKKTFRDKYEAITTDKIDTILGCWVINHIMSGVNDNGRVKIMGSFDVNIWYSFDNNTKTDVEARKINYTELVNVHLKNTSTLTNDSEIIITSLKNPSVIDVSSKNNIIYYEIEKELGIEIIGDAKVKIQIMDEGYEDFDIIDEEMTEEEISNVIDSEINEDYLNSEY